MNNDIQTYHNYCILVSVGVAKSNIQNSYEQHKLVNDYDFLRKRVTCIINVFFNLLLLLNQSIFFRMSLTHTSYFKQIPCYYLHQFVKAMPGQ